METGVQDFVRRILALCFLNPTINAEGTSDVDIVFNKLFQKNPNGTLDINGLYYLTLSRYPGLQQFCEYFSQTYLVRDNHDQSMMFNVFHLEDHRTNNDLEAWHRVWNNRIINHRHGIWGIIEGFQQENLIAERTLQSLQNGIEVSRPCRTKLLNREENMRRMKVQYLDVTNYTMNNMEYNRHMSSYTSTF